jgi:hypothetical protein
MNQLKAPWALESGSMSGSSITWMIVDATGKKIATASRHAWDPEASSKAEFESKLTAMTAAPLMLAALEAQVEFERLHLEWQQAIIANDASPQALAMIERIEKNKSIAHVAAQETRAAVFDAIASQKS